MNLRASLALLAWVAGGCPADPAARPEAGPASSSEHPGVERLLAGPGAGLPDLEHLYERAAPSVVSVLARQPLPFLEADRPGFPALQGMGSGFFLDGRGHLATSAGLVQGAEALEVVLHTGRRLSAALIALDEVSDLAVLRVQAPEGATWLPPPLVPELESPPRRGDWVAAMGVPYGLEHTLTAGVLSFVPAGSGWLATDAAVNPGCNGGPLLSPEGRVLGVLHLPETETDGLGRAVPAREAWPVLLALREGRGPARAWLGVGCQHVSLELAHAFALPRAQGALVIRIEPGSPAARAGLERGDVIVALDGQPLEDPTALETAMRRLRPGQPAKLEIFRQGRPMALTIHPRPAPRAH